MSATTKVDSIVNEINTLTAKSKNQQTLETLSSGRTYSKTREKAFDLENVINAFRGLTLADVQDRCTVEIQQSPILPKLAKVLTIHGALAPTVRLPITQRTEVVLRQLAVHSISESPAKHFEQLDKLEPYLAGRHKAPQHMKARAQDTYLKICGQVYFLMFGISGIVQSLDNGPEKDEWVRKRTTLRNQVERHVNLIKKTYGTFDIIMKGRTWWIQFGPLQNKRTRHPQ